MTSVRLLRVLLVFCSLLVLSTAALADQWVTQEDPDSQQFTGCWSVFPTNYLCDGDPYLVDGDDETGSVSFMQGEDAVLEIGYLVPAEADSSKWTIVFSEGVVDPVLVLQFATDLQGFSGNWLNFRVTVTNTGTVNSPYHFDWHDGSDWVVLHSGTSIGGSVSALIFEERVQWFMGGQSPIDTSTWGEIKTIYR